jgi:hypothetical protein
MGAGPGIQSMIFRHAILAALLALSLTAPAGAQRTLQAFPKEPQLQRLSRDEANAVINKLEQAQEKVRLRAPLPVNFELLSGSWANHPMAELPPRDAFLQLKMDTIFSIERRSSDSLWPLFRMSFMPEGPGKRYWEVDVLIAPTGQIERVAMVFKNPAPY